MTSKKAHKEFTEATRAKMEARREKAIEAYAGKQKLVQEWEQSGIENKYVIGLRDRVERMRKGLVNRGVL